MDDTRTRDPRADRPRPELPQSLAWLSEPAVEPAADRDAVPTPVAEPPPLLDAPAVDEPLMVHEPVTLEEPPPPLEEPPPPLHDAAVPPDRPALDDPALQPLWLALRETLHSPARANQNGFGARGDAAVDVRGLDRAGRRALAGLLRVPAVRAATRVDVAQLTPIVQELTGLGPAAAAQRFAPVPEPRRRARGQTRTAPLRMAKDWLGTHPEVAAQAWTPGWLETVRRDAVAETGITEHEVVCALEILAAVLDDDEPGWRVRGELAAQAADDENALDEGSAVATLVLRGLATAAGVLPPPDPAARRRLWLRFRVLPDLVSTTCLAVGVAPAGDPPAARWLEAARTGTPVHITGRDLRAASGPWVPVDGRAGVLVLDSPRALEAVADRFRGGAAAVCTDGVPGPVTLDLLGKVQAGGAALRFTTGFDQPGLAIGTLLAERFAATPWRMTCEVYRAAARADLPPLTGRVPEPAWAGVLPAEMSRAGRAVPVEQVLDDLLDALAAELEKSLEERT